MAPRSVGARAAGRARKAAVVGPRPRVAGARARGSRRSQGWTAAGARSVKGPAYGGGTSDWATIHRDDEGDNEGGRGEESGAGRRKEFENEFVFLSSSFIQGLVRRGNSLIGRLSATIVREFSLQGEVSEDAVSFLLKGVIAIAGLTFLRLLLGLFFGLFVVGFLGVFFLKYLRRGGILEDKDDEGGYDFYDGEEGGGAGSGRSTGGSSRSDDDVIDVRIYPSS